MLHTWKNSASSLGFFASSLLDTEDLKREIKYGHDSSRDTLSIPLLRNDLDDAFCFRRCDRVELHSIKIIPTVPIGMQTYETIVSESILVIVGNSESMIPLVCGEVKDNAFVKMETSDNPLHPIILRDRSSIRILMSQNAAITLNTWLHSIGKIRVIAIGTLVSTH